MARNYALLLLRRTREVGDEQLACTASENPDLDLEEPLRDEELRMLFICCHPDLNAETRVVLSLKLVGGFGVGEIARVLLTPEATIAKRLVRTKKTFRERALVPFSSCSSLGEI